VSARNEFIQRDNTPYIVTPVTNNPSVIASPFLIVIAVSQSPECSEGETCQSYPSVIASPFLIVIASEAWQSREK